jgi:hypothetical protein
LSLFLLQFRAMFAGKLIDGNLMAVRGMRNADDVAAGGCRRSTVNVGATTHQFFGVFGISLLDDGLTVGGGLQALAAVERRSVRPLC